MLNSNNTVLNKRLYLYILDFLVPHMVALLFTLVITQLCDNGYEPKLIYEAGRGSEVSWSTMAGNNTGRSIEYWREGIHRIFALGATGEDRGHVSLLRNLNFTMNLPLSHQRVIFRAVTRSFQYLRKTMLAAMAMSIGGRDRAYAEWLSRSQRP